MVKNKKGNRNLIDSLERFWPHFYHYSGVGYVHWMIEKPIETEKSRRPSNFVLWVIGIHFALLGFSYQRFENAVTRKENGFNSLVEQLNSAHQEEILQLIIEYRKELIPVEPKFWPPNTVYESLSSDRGTVYPQLDKKMESTLMTYIPKTDSLTLRGVNLRNDLHLYSDAFRCSSCILKDISLRDGSAYFWSSTIRNVFGSADNLKLVINDSRMQRAYFDEVFGSLELTNDTIEYLSMYKSTLTLKLKNNWYKEVEIDSTIILLNMPLNTFPHVSGHNIFFKSSLYTVASGGAYSVLNKVIENRESKGDIFIDCRINGKLYSTSNVIYEYASNTKHYDVNSYWIDSLDNNLRIVVNNYENRFGLSDEQVEMGYYMPNHQLE
ncbi:MAG: hypothetical protein ABJP45_01550 [Cyclobacteriaceae bacterium]